jgi:hypothetical protein
MSKKEASISKKNKIQPGYKVIVSVSSPSLSYTSKRLGDLVTEEMEEGWVPYGSPMLAVDEENYVMSQAVIRQ